MIRSEVVANGSVLLHTAIGIVTIRDASQAMIISTRQSLPIVWDLRAAARAKDNFWFFELSPKIANYSRSVCSDQKRAFVIQQTDRANLLEEALNRSQPPWPWAIFDVMDTAISWCRHLDCAAN